MRSAFFNFLEKTKSYALATVEGDQPRVCGELAEDDNRDVKVAMLEKMPNLKAMYNSDDGNMEMLYFKCGKATFSSFADGSETVTF
ncbi:MAG: hypothetical protein IJ257_04995 [Treponema sp.]|nr:hypothetical protein [Treponema sp.]